MVSSGFAAVGFLCLTAAATAQSVLHVPAQHATIQAAIQAAQNGDTVLVAPGTYVESIDFLGKAIRVASSAGRDVTTLTRNGLPPSAVLCISGEGPATILEGFTIRDGVGAAVSYVVPGSGLLLPFGHAGGAVVGGSSPTIRDCWFKDNSAPTSLFGQTNSGAGNVDCIASNAHFERCVFEGGLGQPSGIVSALHFAGPGGLLIAEGGSPTFLDCGFVDNFGGAIFKAGAGGIQIRSANATFENCYIGANVGGNGVAGGTGGIDILAGPSTQVVFRNTIIAANSAGNGSPSNFGSVSLPLQGAGVLINTYSGAPTIVFDHCTIGGNGWLALLPAGAIPGVMVVGPMAPSITITNSIVWGNPTEAPPNVQIAPGCTIVSSSIQNLPPSAQNLLADPDYVAFPYDLRLGRTSTCIDAAVFTPTTPSTDAELDPRAFPFWPDLGADEFTLSATAKDGSVFDSQGRLVDLLAINGSPGTPGKVRRVPLGQAITLSIAQPPLHANPAAHAIFGYIGVPSGAAEFALPFQVGNMVFAPNAFTSLPDPAQFWLADSVTNPPLGVLHASPTPFALTHAPGLTFPYRVTFQAVIEALPGIFGVTNAVILDVQ